MREMNISGFSGFNIPILDLSNTRQGQVIDFNTTMTSDDKKLFKAATGYDVGTETTSSGSLKVPHLAVAISLARATGSLKGPVTAEFLNRYCNDATIGKTTLRNARDYLESISEKQSGRPGYAVSFTV